MKVFLRIMSYLIAFLLGCTVMLAVITWRGIPTSKLDQLETLILSRFIGESNPTAMEDAAAKAMVASLGDRWSYYASAEEYRTLQEQQENAYVGIGITIMPSEEGDGFRIISVHPNGSAKEAGILPGDVIFEAGGQSTVDMTLDVLRGIIRGSEGTSVQICVLRGEEALEFQVVRALILTDVVKYQLLEDGIGLIAIANFDARCAQETIDAVEELLEQGASALVFDVRNNPGGYADELVKLLDYLLPEGDLFRTVDYAGREHVDTSDAACLEIPMAVLCNEESYSAAEFFAAAIQEYEAGVVVGMPTCGKGYFQYTFQLMDGSAAGLSVGKYFTPSGISLAGVGIQPDVQVEVDEETYYAIASGTAEPGDDPQLQAAMEALR